MSASLTSYAPTGTDARLDATIAFRVDDAAGLDPDNVSFVVTDPHGTATTALAGSSVFHADWPGRISVDVGADFAEVTIERHPALMTGEWTAAVYVSSVLVSSWTFEVRTPLAGVLECLRSLLQGRSGTGRTMSTGVLRHVDTVQDAVGALAAAGPERPFIIRTIGPGTMGPLEICGDHDTTSRIIRLTIAFSTRRQALLEFEQDWARVDEKVRHVLEWPLNWALAGGWIGCEVRGPVFEELQNGSNGQVEVVLTHYDLDCSLREHHP